MISPNEIQNRLEHILLRVQKPGRYVGGEYNQILKDWNKVSTHVALVFPDIYDLGLPNLGLAILYDLLNKRPDVLAERAYAPWLDMETAMRQKGIPLYTLESKHTLADFDIIGFSLPYETLFTNVLNILDMSGIPVKSSERDGQSPLIIAGGHSTFNPEPMSAFIDAFVIGEGEEVIQEIVDAFHMVQVSKKKRAELLVNLAKIPGVYVPSLYFTEYNPDGTLSSFINSDKTAPIIIKKRILSKLPSPPTQFIVPSIDVVHNRIAIEIMRGCTRGCRFCHAGIISRPVRERSVDEIVDSIQQSLENTGFEEIALLSLSSSDYSHILELVEAISQRFLGQHLAISLPSLRIESTSVDLFEKLRGSRQGGFTLAPEAATDRMRNIINKPISDSQLIETVRAIYSRGWQTIKLYFMIGHPSETLEDVQAIASLCRMVISEGRKLIGGRANLNIGISTFIPKPHTPFQWVACDSVANIEAKQRLLKRELSGPGIKLNWTDTKDSMLEAWLSRGDRRMSQVIYLAWKKGARFDAWQDQDNYEVWKEAFFEAGIDPSFYSHRTRLPDEIFPWDHIHTGVSRRFLCEDYNWSMKGETRGDCRDRCYGCGILSDYIDLRRINRGDQWKCPKA